MSNEEDNRHIKITINRQESRNHVSTHFDVLRTIVNLLPTMTTWTYSINHVSIHTIKYSPIIIISIYCLSNRFVLLSLTFFFILVYIVQSLSTLDFPS